MEQPVAIESSAQRHAAASAQAELRRARFIPVLWTTRVLVLLIGAPVALFGITVGMLMARQDRNSDEVALAALTNRIELRIAECIARAPDPLPERAAFVVENREEPTVSCSGDCPAVDCVRRAVAPLVRQGPLGFSRTFELDFAADRALAFERTLELARKGAAATHVVVKESADGLAFTLACELNASAVVEEVPATFRERVDVERVRAAIERVDVHCANF